MSNSIEFTTIQSVSRGVVARGAYVLEIIRFSEILMVRQKSLEFLLLVKAKVLNFIGMSLNFVPTTLQVPRRLWPFSTMRRRRVIRCTFYSCDDTPGRREGGRGANCPRGTSSKGPHNTQSFNVWGAS